MIESTKEYGHDVYNSSQRWTDGFASPGEVARLCVCKYCRSYKRIYSGRDEIDGTDGRTIFGERSFKEERKVKYQCVKSVAIAHILPIAMSFSYKRARGLE